MMPVAPRRKLDPNARVGEWTAPDGWRHRRFDWPAADDRRRLLFQTGRADMFEKYLDAFEHFHAQGWSITAFDWRGQGGSGRLAEDDTGHIDDFATLVDDLAAFWRDWHRPGARHTVLGHSMGGFLTLRALAEGRFAPDAAVLVAPMLGLRAPMGAVLGHRLATWMAGRGDPRRPAWRRGESARAARQRQQRLTHDIACFAEQQAWRRDNPQLCLGSPSWSWVAQAFAATAALRADPRLSAITTPVQFVLADADRLVDAGMAAAVATRLPHAEVVRFGPESAHEILREIAPVRARAYAAIDGFLDRVAP